MIKKFILLGLLTCLSNFLFAQDFKQTLLAMRQQYKEGSQLHIIMEIRVYEKDNLSVPFFHEKAEVMKKGSNYSYRFAENEMLMNEKCILMIDHASKEMVYGSRDAAAQEKYMSQFDMNMDSILTFYDIPQYKGKKNDIDHFHLVQKVGEVTDIDFYIDTKKLLLQKLSYKYKSGQVAVIDFLKFDTNAIISSDQFDEARMLTRAKGKLVATPAFLNYRIAMTDPN